MTQTGDGWLNRKGEPITHAEWLAKGQALADRIEARFAALKANGGLSAFNQRYKALRQSGLKTGYPQYLLAMKRKAMKDLVMSARR